MANKKQMGVYGKELPQGRGKKNGSMESYVSGTRNNPKIKDKSLTPKAKMKKKQK